MDERHQSTEIPTVDVYVVEPGGPCNQYRWDTRLGVLVLDGILRPTSPRGADLARLPLDPRAIQAARDGAEHRRPAWAQDVKQSTPQHLLASLGPSLQVLVLADPPNPPGTRLSVRIIGAVDLAAQTAATRPAAQEMPVQAEEITHMLALALPAADLALTHVRDVRDLPEALATRLEHALTHIHGLASVPVGDHSRFIAANTVLERLRATRANIRVAQRATERAERLLPQERLSGSRTTEPSAREARIALGTSSAPAFTRGWRGLSGLSVAELRTRGEAVYGEAEHLLRWVPTRFVRYLDELLLPNEPLLFFAECPAFTVRGWTGQVADLTNGMEQKASSNRPAITTALGRLRARHVQAGLLLVTDRQIMLLRDYAAPDATLVQWGYRAQSWPLSLLAGVRLLAPEIALDRTALEAWPHDVQERVVGPVRFDETTLPPRLARLVLALEGRHGVEITGAAFPAQQRDALVAGARLLEGFLPFPATSSSSDKRVRVVTEVEQWRPTETEAAELVSLGGMIPEQVALSLEQALREVLHDGEQVLVQARTPSASGDRNDSSLLALTRQRLILVCASADARGKSHVASYPHDSITSVTLQHSLMACELRWHVPGTEHSQVLEVQRVRFPSPLIVPFRALYTRLRLLL